MRTAPYAVFRRFHTCSIASPACCASARPLMTAQLWGLSQRLASGDVRSPIVPPFSVKPRIKREPTWLQELSQHCNGVDIVQFDFCEVAVETKREIHIDSDVNMIVQGEGAVVWKRAYRRELVADLRQ